jgi:small subunit ribosomal protein S9
VKLQLAEESAYFGLGKRKRAIAQVKLVPGSGSLFVNNKPGEVHFQNNAAYINAIEAPLTVLGLEKEHDIHVKTNGGGLNGQADAIKLGVARALVSKSEAHKPALKAESLLTRDARRKERKKYGLKKARKAPQFSKR